MEATWRCSRQLKKLHHSLKADESNTCPCTPLMSTSFHIPVDTVLMRSLCSVTAKKRGLFSHSAYLKIKNHVLTQVLDFVVSTGDARPREKSSLDDHGFQAELLQAPFAHRPVVFDHLQPIKEPSETIYRTRKNSKL
jgi:hypothetical protein